MTHVLLVGQIAVLPSADGNNCLKDYLRLIDCEVMAVASLGEAKLHLRQSPCELIIMPLYINYQGEGYPFLDWLHLHRKGLPVILVDEEVFSMKNRLRRQEYTSIVEVLTPQDLNENYTPVRNAIDNIQSQGKRPGKKGPTKKPRG